MKWLKMGKLEKRPGGHREASSDDPEPTYLTLQHFIFP